MKYNDNDILEFKIEGKDKTPEKIHIKEALELLLSYENALSAIVEKKDPNVILSESVLSLVDIEEGSARYIIRPKSEYITIYLQAAFFIALQLRENDLAPLPAKAIKNLGNIHKYSKNNNCSIHFLGGKEKELAVISPESTIELPETKFVYGETVIYGRILRVGGVEPKAYVQLEGQKGIAIKIRGNKEKLAKSLAQRLYEVVGLKGNAKWLIEDYSLEEFELTQIINYERQSYKNTFNELREIIGEYWDEVDDIEKELE